MDELYIKLDFLEAQLFMKGGYFPSNNLYFDSNKNCYFIPKREYDKAMKDDYKV